MQISENQLKGWGRFNAKNSSKATYNSIRTALSKHSWPDRMGYRVYLQGSYQNSTNIRGNSDVDVVVEANHISCDNHFNRPNQLFVYEWREFRAEVERALMAYYGNSSVEESSSGKCLKVTGEKIQLNADVVPCAKYNNYYKRTHKASGIILWTNSNLQIVNFPTLHHKNGLRKNKQTNGGYKPMVRILKNARNAIGNNLPSYVIECMIYNVPPHCFASSFNFSDNLYEVLRHLRETMRNRSLQNFICQNEQQYLFDDRTDQTRLETTYQLIYQLIDLWIRST